MSSGSPVSFLDLAPVAAASSSRLQALYSGFSRQKQSNPASYNANVEWWRRILESFVQGGLQTNGSHLVLVYGLNGKPIGLGAVITELLGSNSAVPFLFPLSTFLAASLSIYASSSWRIPSVIANYVLVKPLWWMLEQVGAVDLDIFLFLEMKETDLMSELDAKALLRHLERDKAAVGVDTSKNIIKFFIASAEAISAVDIGILELRTVVKTLHHQIEGIQNRIEIKPISISYLKSRKQLEELLRKRLGSLATLEGTLIVEIISTFQSSTATLKKILAHPSLQRDEIGRTMDTLADANANPKEVDDALRLGMDATLKSTTRTLTNNSRP
ncbi:hypothetical protein C8J56DRAFT_1029362 [Mycena floridula]|nr:hypothetical protein C8J56DRAFT_1029362 [Mycena floridula]